MFLRKCAKYLKEGTGIDKISPGFLVAIQASLLAPALGILHLCSENRGHVSRPGGGDMNDSYGGSASRATDRHFVVGQDKRVI